MKAWHQSRGRCNGCNFPSETRAETCPKHALIVVQNMRFISLLCYFLLEREGKCTGLAFLIAASNWACAQVVDGLFMRLLSRPLGVVRIRWGICRRGWCGCGGGCRSLRSRWTRVCCSRARHHASLMSGSWRPSCGIRPGMRSIGVVRRGSSSSPGHRFPLRMRCDTLVHIDSCVCGCAL